MVRLYSGSGSKEVQVLEKVLLDEAWAVLRGNVIRLLNVRRGGKQAAELLSSIPFELREGTNGFNDEFCILYYRAPLEQYVELAESFERDQLEHEYRRLAEAVTEAGHYIRFIVLDLDPESGPAPVATPSLEIRSDTVERALADVEQLLSRPPNSAYSLRPHTGHASLETGS